jgi:hypothetical protein
MPSMTPLAEFLASLIGSFDSKEKGTAVVLLMTVLFIFLAVGSAWRHRFFISRIRGGTTTGDHAVAEASWSPADRLNAVTKALEGNAVLGTAWNLYRTTLRDDPRREGAFVNLVEPRTTLSPAHPWRSEATVTRSVTGAAESSRRQGEHNYPPPRS